MPDTATFDTVSLLLFLYILCILLLYRLLSCVVFFYCFCFRFSCTSVGGKRLVSCGVALLLHARHGYTYHSLTPFVVFVNTLYLVALQATQLCRLFWLLLFVVHLCWRQETTIVSCTVALKLYPCPLTTHTTSNLSLLIAFWLLEPQSCLCILVYVVLLILVSFLAVHSVSYSKSVLLQTYLLFALCPPKQHQTTHSWCLFDLLIYRFVA